MFHNTAKTTTNAGVFPANVPQHGQNNNKTRKFSRKCSKKPPKQQHFPEKKLPQMFQKTTKTATNAGEKTPENVQNKKPLDELTPRGL